MPAMAIGPPLPNDADAIMKQCKNNPKIAPYTGGNGVPEAGSASPGGIERIDFEHFGLVLTRNEPVLAHSRFSYETIMLAGGGKA
jgi:hypothetical protein